MEKHEKAYVALEKEELLEEEEELVEIENNDEFKPTDSIKYKAGKYAWIVELPMMKSFFLLFEVWRVLGIAGLILGLINFLIGLIAGEGLGAFTYALITMAIVLGIMFILSIPAYYIVTKANDGKYTVLFEMDNDGVDHTQIKTPKAEALDALTILVGTTARKFSIVGSGLINASGSSLYTKFSRVRKIKADREKGLIRLNGLIMRNQIYVDEENFPFVYSYIKRRCIHAKEV